MTGKKSTIKLYDISGKDGREKNLEL